MFKAILTTAVLASTFAAAAPAQVGNHRRPPIANGSVDFSLNPDGYKVMTVSLNMAARYSITARHNPDSVYPHVFPPPPDDVKLHVQRVWNGQKGPRKDASGLGAALLRFESTRQRIPQYEITVVNKSRTKKQFRLTISSNR